MQGVLLSVDTGQQEVQGCRGGPPGGRCREPCRYLEEPGEPCTHLQGQAAGAEPLLCASTCQLLHLLTSSKGTEVLVTVMAMVATGSSTSVYCLLSTVYCLLLCW